MKYTAKKLNILPQIREAGCLEKPLELVIGIGKNNLSATKLINILNEGTKNINGSVELEALKKKYGVD